MINWTDKLSGGYNIKDDVFEVPKKISAIIEEQYNDPILYEEVFFEQYLTGGEYSTSSITQFFRFFKWMMGNFEFQPNYIGCQT